ncbi:MAG TPA: D-glycero-beta-D-manno-heptose-7-phosphate kinase [candidate division Zixibacteria bacterium]|nr:D-glycero-beta-D-manno-heptose-7-phosphate kinase [candidate division Zixibacteria bacterium]HBZ01624.1 D-glycero-beta-D-manno-heptose-7-phosphate kinase [candidate division Zixibacteria bacterium]
MNKTKISKLLANFPKSRIAVLGDIMLDRYLWGNVERISPEAPVPVVNVNKETTNLGGAANVAANVRALGADVTLLGITGDDMMAEILKTNLTDSDLKTSGLLVDKDRPTTVKTRIVAHNQQVVRIDRESIAEIPAPLVEQLIAKIGKLIKNLDGLIISDYGKGVITYDLLSSIIPLAKEAGVFIAVDPKEVHFMNYREVSVITPNHHEAGFISGKKIINESVLADVGWNLMDLLNLESLLITRGEKGMALFEKDRKLTLIPAQAKTVYDVTGAGDTVIATLTVAKSAGATMQEASIFANAAAGLAVAQFGTARITADELKAGLIDSL